MRTLEAVTDADLRKHRPMVREIARRLISHLPSSIEFDDLEQAGLLAVATSLGRFDPGKMAADCPEDLDLAFVRFAKRRVRGAMLDQLRTDDDFASRVERRLQRDAGAATQKLLGDGIRPTSQAIADELGVTPDEIDALDRIPYLAANDEEDVGGMFDATDGVTAEDEASRLQMLQGVLEAMEALPSRLKAVITLRYVDGLTLREIGKRLGVCESRALQLHHTAIAYLSKQIKDAESRPESGPTSCDIAPGNLPYIDRTGRPGAGRYRYPTLEVGPDTRWG